MGKGVVWQFDSYMQEIFQMKEVDPGTIFSVDTGLHWRYISMIW